VSRLSDHFSVEEFLDLLAAAYDSPDLSESDLDFLADIESKYDRWGDQMFFSDRQADYLKSLAARGEDVCMDDDEIEEVIYISKRRGSV
jgi:hypothetical protein